MASDIEDLVRAYFRYLDARAEQDFWAWEKVDALCDSLGSGMEVTLKPIQAAPDKRTRDCAAAHALEDLVYRHGSRAVDEIGRLAAKSLALRLVPPVINVDDDSEARSGWARLLRQYHEDAKL